MKTAVPVRRAVRPHELKDPDTGIRTGVDCLRRFRQGFSEITDPEEKVKFTLALEGFRCGRHFISPLELQGGKTVGTLLNQVDFLSVSYTPLDVYKRQQ